MHPNVSLESCNYEGTFCIFLGCISNVGGARVGYSHCKPQNNNEEETGNHGSDTNRVSSEQNGIIEQLQEKYR